MDVSPFQRYTEDPRSLSLVFSPWVTASATLQEQEQSPRSLWKGSEFRVTAKCNPISVSPSTQIGWSHTKGAHIACASQDTPLSSPKCSGENWESVSLRVCATDGVWQHSRWHMHSMDLSTNTNPTVPLCLPPHTWNTHFCLHPGSDSNLLYFIHSPECSLSIHNSGQDMDRELWAQYKKTRCSPWLLEEPRDKGECRLSLEGGS